MTSKLGTREIVSIVLLGIMFVCLVFTLTGETIDFLWLRQPIGNIAATAADVFGWLFAVAFIAQFVLAMATEEKKPRRLGSRSFRPEH